MKPSTGSRRVAALCLLLALYDAAARPETVRHLRGSDPRNWQTHLAEHNFPERGSLTGSYLLVLGAARNFIPARLAVDAQGSAYVAGTVSWEFGTDAALIKVDRTGRIAFTTIFGGDGLETVSSVGVDSAGRAYIAGTTRSADFPGLRLGGGPGEGLRDAFVVRLTPEGGLSYAVRFGGSRSAETGGLAVDREGAVYVAGTTDSQDFPFTAGALRSALPGPTVQSVGFVLKLSPDGNRPVYAAALGGARTVCAETGPCVGPLVARSSAGAIAVDAAGNAYVAGITNATDFPATTGALSSDCRCSVESSNAFVAKVAANGDRLLFSTFLSARSPSAFHPGVVVADLALHSSGSIFVTGFTTSDQFPATSGAWRTARDPATVSSGEPAAFAARLSPDASRLEYSTFLSGLAGEHGVAIRTDGAGNAYVTGGKAPVGIIVRVVVDRPAPTFAVAAATDLPISPGGFARGGEFFVKLAPDGASALFSTRLPDGFGGQDIGLDPLGSVLLVGRGGYLSRMTLPELPPILGVANAAGSPVSGRIAPGELISIFGPAIGPAEPVGLRLDERGRVATTLAGVEVRIGGVSAPLLYARRDQINAVVPFRGFLEVSPTLEVLHAGRSVRTVRLAATLVDPAVFRAEGDFAAALNEDGTVNSRENPARPGTVVSVFATGLGPFFPPLEDGEVPSGDQVRLFEPVAVQDLARRTLLPVLYAGQAPGLVAGVAQINFRLPPGLVLEDGDRLWLTLSVRNVTVLFAIHARATP